MPRMTTPPDPDEILSPSAPPARGILRSVGPSVFLPALVYECGNGAIAPIIALTALDVGAGPVVAAYMLALLGIGQVLGDVPSSFLADRIGDRRAMLAAALVAIVALIGCFTHPSMAVFGLALIVLGMANATFYLARQSYLTEVIPIGLRARAMSTLAGAHRIGLFIGPFLGALAIAIAGLRTPYLVAMLTAALTIVLLVLIPDAEQAGDIPPPKRGGSTVAAMLSTHRRLFATLGFAVLAVGAVRAARQTVLPLWSEHIGLSAEQTSLVFGIASAVDMALFYPASKVMDRYGRLSVAISFMLIVGGAMIALPLTGGVLSLTVVAMIMSFGNGIGSGIMMTLGADVAPADSRIRFLSLWRLMSDAGNAAGPVLVSIGAAVWTLAAGIIAIGSVGVIGAGALALWVPRYSLLATRQMARAHRDGVRSPKSQGAELD